jgi:hypothetical protein
MEGVVMLSSFVCEDTQSSMRLRLEGSRLLISHSIFGKSSGRSIVDSALVQECRIEGCLFDRPRESCFDHDGAIIVADGNKFAEEVLINMPVIPMEIRSIALLMESPETFGTRPGKGPPTVAKGIMDSTLMIEGMAIVLLIVGALWYALTRTGRPKMPQAIERPVVSRTHVRFAAIGCLTGLGPAPTP